jgi:monothiol glutaredoxin
LTPLLQLAPAFRPARTSALTIARRHLSSDARAKIQSAIEAAPAVLFMKGTPAMPQCGFSRAAVQVLDIHGVNGDKLATYDVLSDQELRAGIKEFS